MGRYIGARRRKGGVKEEEGREATQWERGREGRACKEKI
jgi:hypothetical protein